MPEIVGYTAKCSYFDKASTAQELRCNGVRVIMTSKIHEWFLEFEQARWDKQLEADSNAGKLDFLINAALAEHEAGLTREL